MASIQTRDRAGGRQVHRLLYRLDGRSQNLTFDDLTEAQTWKRTFDDHGVPEALRLWDRAVLRASGLDPDLVQRQQAAAAKAAAAVAAEGKPNRVWTVRMQLDQYINNQTGIEDGTRQKYRSIAANDILPYLGDLPLTALIDDFTDVYDESEGAATPPINDLECPTGSDHIRAWINRLASGERLPPFEGKPLSGKTIANKHTLLVSALDWAVARKRIPYNPASGIGLPKTKKRQEMVFLEHAGFVLIRDSLTPFWRPFVTTLVLTGMRFSEATALTVDDIDFRTGFIHVNKAWKYRRTGPRTVGPPKSEAGTRFIPIGDEMNAVLKKQVAGKKGADLVFPNKAGRQLLNNSFHSRIWGKAIKKALALGLPTRPRVHDLRHTFAAWQLEDGTGTYTLARIMGHTDTKMVERVYGHLSKGSMAGVVAAMNEASAKLAAASGKPAATVELLAQNDLATGIVMIMDPNDDIASEVEDEDEMALAS